jgi:hypothetical protein
MVADLDTAVRLIKARHPDVPLAVAGETWAAQWCHDTFDFRLTLGRALARSVPLANARRFAFLVMHMSNYVEMFQAAV